MEDLKLKCLECGIIFDAKSELDEKDVESIDETGFCRECYKHYK